jgi:hypothetical protein
MTNKKSNESRRKLLKSIAAGSGAVIAGKSLPENWSRPVVDSVMLPAHAETSPPPCDISGDWGDQADNTFTLPVNGSNVTGIWNSPSTRPAFSGVLSDGGCTVMMTFPDDGLYRGTMDGPCRIQWSVVNQPDVVDPNNYWLKDDCAPG